MSVFSKAVSSALPKASSRLVSLLFVTSIAFSGASLVHAEASSSEKPCTRLDIGISFSIPPWVIQQNDSGIELDILREALARTGYCVSPNYVAFALAYQLFDRGDLDGVINASKGAAKGGYLSDPVVRFQNIAVSLKSKNYPESIAMDFLSDKNVVAFQKARVFLGPEFAEMAKNNRHYSEVAKQSLQINLLFVRGVDFIVMDQSIFGYYWVKALEGEHLQTYRDKFAQPVRIHKLFAPNDYQFVFKSEQVRDDFNVGLKYLRDSGEYERIVNRYANLTDLFRSAVEKIQKTK